MKFAVDGAEDATKLAGNRAQQSVKLPLATLCLLALAPPSFIMTSMSAVAPMIADYLGGGDVGQGIAQRAQALPFLGLAIGGLIAGALIVRIGLLRSMLIATFFYAVAGIAAGSATGQAVLLPACFLVGFSASLINAGLATCTGAIYFGAARARMLGFQIGFSDFAAIVSSVLSGAAAQYYGWRVAFAIYPAFACLLMILIATSRLPKIQRDPTVPNGLVAVVKLAGPVYLGAAAIMFATGGQAALVPFHLVANGIGNSGVRALILVAVPVFAMVGSTVFGLAREQVGDKLLLLASSAASAAGFAGLAIWHGGPLYAGLSTIAIGIGIGFAFPMVFRAAFGRVPPQLHGYSMGLVTTASFLGAFAGPMTLGPVMRLLGAQTTFFCIAFAWAAIGTSLVLAMSIRRAPTASAIV